jgi:hypothetical protein
MGTGSWFSMQLGGNFFLVRKWKGGWVKGKIWSYSGVYWVNHYWVYKVFRCHGIINSITVTHDVQTTSEALRYIHTPCTQETLPGLFADDNNPTMFRRLRVRRLPVASTRGYAHTAEPPPSSVVFSGIQPTGTPHLGNYLGALRQWVDLQHSSSAQSTRLIFCTVDLHAITQRQDAGTLRMRKREMLAALLAIGLDPKRSVMFEQSRVLQHSELMWILSCEASTGYLGRMTQWKVGLWASCAMGRADFCEYGGGRISWELRPMQTSLKGSRRQS